MITVTYSRTCGFSKVPPELEEMLGLERGGLVRNPLAQDLVDDCLVLTQGGIDLKDEAAVRKAFAASPSHLDLPRYADALVLAAKIFRMSISVDDLVADDDDEFCERMKTWGGDRLEAGSVEELEKIIFPGKH
jgi:hypothetical protein